MTKSHNLSELSFWIDKRGQEVYRFLNNELTQYILGSAFLSRSGNIVLQVRRPTDSAITQIWAEHVCHTRVWLELKD